jgi:hypothetical protein
VSGRDQASRSRWGDIEGCRERDSECLAYAGSDDSVLVAEAGAQRRGVGTRNMSGARRQPHDLTRYQWGLARYHLRRCRGGDQTVRPAQALRHEDLT